MDLKTFPIFLIAVFSIFPLTNFAQSPTATPAPVTVGTPTPIREPLQLDVLRRRSAGGDQVATPGRVSQFVLAKYIDPLYRKPSPEDLKPVAVEPEIRAMFREFLALPSTGIFKLVPDLGCDEGTVVVSASDACMKFKLPGAGNSYSFRSANYQLRRLSDLWYSGSSFRVPGVLMHGILVRLGDIRIDSLTLASAGVDGLNAFRPSSDRQDFDSGAQRLQSGFVANGFRYSNAVPIEMNTTYALRTVGYRGSSLRSFQGITYNELDYDKRRDVTVVFRTVGFDQTGAITIIWRELRNIEAPKLKG